MVNSSLEPSLIISSQDKGWKSIIVEEVQQPSGAIASGFRSEHTIYLSLTTCSGRIVQAIDNRSYTGLYTKGDLTIIPAKISGSYLAYDDDRYLQIRIPPNLLAQVAIEAFDTDIERLKLRTELRDRDIKIEQLAMMLRAELYEDNNGDGLYVESLAKALVVNLLRNYSGIEPFVAIYSGGLGDRALIKATDYIREHLSQPIKIRDIAAFLGISQFHFSRLFKQSTGKTPYQYVIEQRIELAKQLLKKEDRAIMDIALDCGFNSQSHLGKHFLKATGITPRQYRQN